MLSVFQVSAWSLLLMLIGQSKPIKAMDDLRVPGGTAKGNVGVMRDESVAICHLCQSYGCLYSYTVPQKPDQLFKALEKKGKAYISLYEIIYL